MRGRAGVNLIPHRTSSHADRLFEYDSHLLPSGARMIPVTFVADAESRGCLLTLLQLPLIEVGNAVRADCYSIASYP